MVCPRGYADPAGEGRRIVLVAITGGADWNAAGRRLDGGAAERVLFALVAQRALEPGSKLAATRWVAESWSSSHAPPKRLTRTQPGKTARCLFPDYSVPAGLLFGYRHCALVHGRRRRRFERA